MSAAYTRWIHHGESVDTVVVENLEQEVEGSDHDFGIHVDVADDDYDEDHGVPEMIGDLYATAEADGEQPRFARVLEDAKKSLSPGSSHSKFSFLVRMLYIKSHYRIGNTAFSTMLKLLSSGYHQSELPKSYDEAKKYLGELGLGFENIHVCKNNCVLFRKRYYKENVCPVYKASRWQDETGNKRVPHKVLRHFPLLPRLKRIFASKRTFEETQWHKKMRTPVDNVMSHLADGEAWKEFDTREPTFADDSRNLRLALATDGFNPFGNMSTQYSMWPVLLTPLNLPPWECVNPANYFMSLLILGPKSPGKDFDLFLEPLIEELLDLWKGVSTYDACTGRKFNLRAAMLWCIHDFPALSTLSGRTTKGYYACIHCDKDPLSRAIRSKICYIGHRRYLPRTHAWRRSLAFDGKRENKDQPGKFTLEEVLEELEKVKDVRPGKHPEIIGNKRKHNEGLRIYSRKVGLWRLPYWKHLKLPYNLDVMHIEKNICENILGTLLNVQGKTKDTTNARLDLHDMGIRPELHLQQHGNSVNAPLAPYVLGKDQKIEFYKFLKGIKFPDGYAANLARYISEDGSKVQGKLKTHSCHILLQRIIPAGLRGLVRKDVYEAVVELRTFFRELCSRNLRIDVVKQLKEEILLILCKLEKIFPPAFFDVMVHLAVHLPDEALLRGPVQYGWMYPIERRLGTLKNFVRNRARPEGSIAEAYMASDTLTFCSRYMEDIDNRFNHDDGSDGEMPLPDDISIFKHGVTLVGSNRSQYIDDVDLNNLYRDDLEQQGALDVDKMIENKCKENPESVSEGLWALSCGPDLRVKTCVACKVNGVRYSTVDHENFLLTQNSGVMTEGSHDGNNIDLYGVLKESLWYKTDPFILVLFAFCNEISMCTSDELSDLSVTIWKLTEFLDLKLGSMPVMDYVNKFNHLA
ncbi:uncharacterized protein [Miscanthus floridulus]|uniref:uncharacterized protein n=1 Tax=Miscanthus floridulus TaxID=154761 RepID=UPI003457B9DB